MQRSASKFLLIFLTFIIFFSTVAAAPAENKSLTLKDVRYVEGVGIVLLFDSTGLTRKDIKDGTAQVHSNSYNMSCNFKDGTDIVRCVIPGTLSQYAGESFGGSLAGFLFWGEIPAAKSHELVCSDDQSLWYFVNIYEDGELVESGEIPAEFYYLLVEIISQYPGEFGVITFEIVDQYCGEKIIFEEPT